MTKTSLFEFIGEIKPKINILPEKVSYSANRKQGSVTINIDDSKISISFIINYELFEDIFNDAVEFVQSFLSVQSLKTGVPLSFIVHEWIEYPLEPINVDRISHPVRGRIYQDSTNAPKIPGEVLPFAIAEGLRWVEDMEWNPFLRRAVLDFNYALQHTINDVPIYLYRAIESAQHFFGGEKSLIDTLQVKSQVKMVKKLADDSQSGLHVRHAARTSKIKKLSEEEIIKAVSATREIIEKFQIDTNNRRIPNN